MNKKSYSNDISLTLNSELVADEIKVASTFSDYYRDSTDSLLVNSVPHPSMCYNERVKKNIYFYPIREAEVRTTINKLKENSMHTSQIPTRLLKLIAPALAQVLTPIFNKCVELGVYPDLLKFGEIIPIHKKGDKRKVENYRPITILHPFSKIFEKIIHNRLVDYFNKFSILSDRQFGFTAGRSIHHAVMSFQYDAYLADHSNLCFGAVFIDYSKAFDTINHSILLYKLEHYGIRGNTLKLLESYLSNRRNCVRIKQTKSAPALYRHGVPQGSALGPLLFNVFLNDIVSVIKDCNVILYADDVVIYSSQSDLFQLELTLSAAFRECCRYSETNYLFINALKTKSMLFNRAAKSSIKISYNSNAIEQVRTIKYLGITIDNKFTFRDHILEIVKKVNQSNRAISFF